jgi:hypothetical protein
MNKIYFPLITFFATIILILFVFYNRYNQNYKEEQINERISKNIDILYENLSFEKKYAQALSIMLSKDSAIINSLKSSNQKMALKRLDEFLKELKSSTKIDYIDIQIHTKDLKAFARNWDKSNYFGAKLDSFRKGLLKVKKQKRSFVSIELGKRLNIKAISPIFDKNGSYIGSIEVISSFKGLKEHLKKFDLSILGLLNKRFLNIAKDLRDNKKIDNYVVVEKSFNKEIFRLLQQNPKILKQKRFFYHINNKIIALLPMKNLGIDDIGLIVLMMPNLNYNQNIAIQDYERANREYKFNKNRRKVIIK